MAGPPENPAAPHSRRPGTVGHLVSWLLIAAATLYMLHAGWNRWNDLFIDFGRELYLPWQITQGKVLYRDLASFNGPLSPYLNALWFRLFGVSLHTLIYCNLAITIAIIAMLYRLVLVVADRFTALAACLAFVFLSAFSQFGAGGNENYLAPYSHEATHGVALSLAALLLFERFLRARRAAWLAAVGAALGLVFLTKVEVFVAATAAITVGWLAFVWADRTPPRRIAAQAAALIGAALLPPLIAFSLLAMAMPARQALLGTLGSSRYAFNSNVTINVYFKTVSGLGQPWANLVRAATSFFAIALLLGAIAAVAWRTRGKGWSRLAVASAVFAAVLLGLAYLMHDIHNPDDFARAENLGRSLPLWMAVLAVFWFILCLTMRAGGRAKPQPILSLMMVAWAAAMLLKMILNARLNHYGFTLAMPALIVFVTAATGWWPDLMAWAGGSRMVLREGALAALVVVVLFHVQVSNANHAALTVPVPHRDDGKPLGQRGDLFYSWPPRADEFNALLALLDDHADKHLDHRATVAVLPEGAMVNFLLRRENPTPYSFVMPSDAVMFGEGNVLAAYQRHPPDYIVLIHRDTSQFGVPFFGRDYARTLGAWVMDPGNYTEVGHVGPRPFQPDNQFGILILRHTGAEVR